MSVIQLGDYVTRAGCRASIAVERFEEEIIWLAREMYLVASRPNRAPSMRPCSAVL